MSIDTPITTQDVPAQGQLNLELPKNEQVVLKTTTVDGVVTRKSVPVEESTDTAITEVPVAEEVKPAEEDNTDAEDTKKEEQESDKPEALPLDLSDVEDATLGDDGYYNSTGNVTVDYIVDTLKSSKVPSDKAAEIFSEVIRTKDVEKLDVKALAELVGEDKAELIKLKIQNLHRQEREFVANIEKDINTYTDGQWDDVSKWARGVLSPEDIDAYNEMIMVGGKNRELAVRDLTSKYKAASATTAPAPQDLRGDGALATSIMTRELYQKELIKHMNPYTGKANNKASEDAIASLDAARQRAIARGY